MCDSSFGLPVVMVQFFKAEILLCIGEVAVVGVALWVTAVLALAQEDIELHTIGHISGTFVTLILQQ